MLSLRERLQAIEDRRRAASTASPPRASPPSSGRSRPPLLLAGSPRSIRLRGGWELLGREGERPSAVRIALRELDPEIIVVMPAGCTCPRRWPPTRRSLPTGGTSSRAVRDGRVFDDAACSFSRPGSRIVDGIELIAEIVDPVAFDGLAVSDSFVRLG
ncbi:MAG: hypothetical protein U0838_07120 [Chloroflexota bacterium]